MSVGHNTRPLQIVMLSHFGAGPDSYIYLLIGPSLARPWALGDSV